MAKKANVRRVGMLTRTQRGAFGVVSTAETVEWTPPQVEDKLETRLGGSFVDEFVLGHSASDILRELVQNEFDAGGHAMAVSFGSHALTISGTGSPVRADGWKRLSVIVGTGRTVGAGADGEVIEAKVNGIGSKNFGLRSLFLYGDRIHVRSAGQVAVLDLPTLGTARVADPGGRVEKGVALQIPYRTERFDKLAPFLIEDEREAFDSMSGAMLATLTKLATLSRKKGLRELALRSERLGRTVGWKQSVSELECRAPGIDALRRTGRMQVHQGGAALPSQSFDEIEFGRSIAIPPEFAAIVPPGYFRRPRRRIRIAVSLPLERGRPTLRAGHFFYPLQAPRGGTGSSIDVSAPFKLVSDRSALRVNDWNKWLCKMAARLVVDLLTRDWYARGSARRSISRSSRASRPTLPSFESSSTGSSRSNRAGHPLHCGRAIATSKRAHSRSRSTRGSKRIFRLISNSMARWWSSRRW